MSARAEGWSAAAPRAGRDERVFNACGEIACQLGVSRARAMQVIERGEALLDSRLAGVECLSRAGLVDEAKTSLIARRLRCEDAGVARAVQERVLPGAVHRTHCQLAKDIDRALAALDPEGSGARRQRNQAGRHVSRPRPAGQGVSRMMLLLPTPDAFLLDATLDAIGASARSAGDERSLGQLRADALTTMVLATLRTSQAAAAATAARATARPITKPATQPDTRRDTQSVERWGAGSAAKSAVLSAARSTDEPAAQPAANSTTQPAHLTGAASTTGAVDGVGSADPWGAFGSWASVDAVGSAGAAGGAEVGAVVGAGVAEAWSGGCREAGFLPDGVPLEGLLATLSGLMSSTGPWWSPSGNDPVFPPPGLSVNVDVTVSLDQLVSLLDDPDPTGPGSSAPTSRGGSAPTGAGGSVFTGAGGSVFSGPDPGAPAAGASAASNSVVSGLVAGASASVGLGAMGSAAGGSAASLAMGRCCAPVPAVVARALAAGGSWRRLVTDPLSGTVVDVGRSRYRPPAGLADLVRARDASCTYPGCQVPAVRCDIDHVRPWAEGGTTSWQNLACLCQAHHRLKHTPGWLLTRTPEGSLTWRTPTGARYERRADGSVRRLAQRVGPRGMTRPGGRVPAWLERAVTAPVIARLDKGLKDAAEHTRTQTQAQGWAQTQTPTGAQAWTESQGEPQPQHGPQTQSSPQYQSEGGPQTQVQVQPVLESRGPRPGEWAGAFETVPYDRALHILGLAPLLDEVIPY
nr:MULTISPECIES: HNH endonuclease [Actinomyces]